MQNRSLCTTRTAAITVVFCLLIAPSVLGRPNIRSAFFAEYPNAVGSILDNAPSIQGHCGVCHYQFTGAGPRNPFGVALGNVLPQYPNNENGRRQAMRAIQNVDHDVDGYTTLVEVTDTVNFVNTPTFPGLNQTNVQNVSGVDPADILPYLVPTGEIDTESPVVTLLSPNGGQSWEGGSFQMVQWSATDNVEVIGVQLFYRDAEAAPWTMIARGLSNSGTFSWPVPNTPSPAARVRAVAYDAAGNQGEDASDAVFSILNQPGGIVPTTLRDFHLPGTQPFGVTSFSDRTACSGCHGGYDPAVEMDWNFRGSMMAQAARDPLFFACLTIAEQDAPSSGDLCLRCHTPFGWMLGRSNPTNGSLLNALDRNGVSCDFCHRKVDPIYEPGVNPPDDQEVLAGLAPGDLPYNHANGQYVVDPIEKRRGPFSDPAAPHPWLHSPFHRSSEFCGTCHDVSNPVFTRTGLADYAPGPLDEKPDSVHSEVLMPLERTYSEWKHSQFNTPGGVYAPEFAGNLPGGMVSICQDCHMRDVNGRGANDVNAPIRPDIPLHDMTGGNSWMPPLIAQLYPSEVDLPSLQAAASRAVSMLQKAALVDMVVTVEGDSFRVNVTVTNRTGHKLPTGYPEGRRAWLHMVARDEGGNVVYESAAWDPLTGELSHDEDARIYEVKLGISPALAGALSLEDGPSFHFTLNDSIYKDNRIPPLGFTNAEFETFGGQPVDPEHPGPGPRYADGQNWDVVSYALPPSARTATATLYYQTLSKDYVEFLLEENTTNSNGQILHDLWSANGRSAPVAMAADSASFSLAGVEEGALAETSLDARPVPFTTDLELSLTLARPERVRLEVFDLQGRMVTRLEDGIRSAGAHRLVWDGRDGTGRDVGSGVFWVRLRTESEILTRRVVRLR